MTWPAWWNQRIETMPAPKMRVMQEAKLQRQLRYLWENSPFYRQKFTAAGVRPEQVRTLADLTHFPFTTKDELRQSQTEAPPLGHHAAVPLERLIRMHSSSGTTGRPSYVGITARDRDIWTEVVSRVYWCEGTRPDSRVVMGFGIGFFVGGLPLHDAIENIGAMFIPVGTGNSDRLVTSIQHVGADILTCTPSYALYLAEWVRDKLGISARELGIKRILCGAEPGGSVPGVRDRIEEAWGAFVTESLGNADILPTYAAQCDERQGNHFLAPDYLHLEVIDPDSGQALAIEDGVEGELVATHLDRDCVPLVRFRTRDRVRVWNSPCRCGRTGFRVQCVGRTDDMLIIAGVNCFPSAIRDVVAGFRPRVTGEIQIVLHQRPPRVEPPLPVRVEYSAAAGDLVALQKEIEHAVRQTLIVPARVELVPEGSLPRFEMKAQLFARTYED